MLPFPEMSENERSEKTLWPDGSHASDPTSWIFKDMINMGYDLFLPIGWKKHHKSSCGCSCGTVAFIAFFSFTFKKKNIPLQFHSYNYRISLKWQQIQMYVPFDLSLSQAELPFPHSLLITGFVKSKRESADIRFCLETLY